MSNVLHEIQRMIENSTLETDGAIDLIDYLNEDMTDEIYALLVEGEQQFISIERVNMMFTLLSTSRKKLNVALKIQKDVMDYIQAVKEREKEKVPARAATQAEGQKQNN